MEMKFGFIVFAVFFTGLICSSCAVEEESMANEDEKMYLEAWLSIHHPEAERLGMGIYELSTERAESEKTVQLPCYARVTYTVTDLEGNVSSTSDMDVAKRIGTFNESYYYGPRVWYVAENAITRGQEDMLVGLPEGSSRTAVIPGWLQSNFRYDTEEEYMAEVTDKSPQIYIVKIDEITDDIMQWQKDEMAEHAAEYVNGTEPVFEGFYFYSKTAAAAAGEDSESGKVDFHKDTTIFINYTGRRLDGQVFDTSIENVAKDYHIHDASKTYGPVEVTMSTDSTKIELDGNSVITGFASTLWRVTEPFEKCTGMFWSSMGYGSGGSGSQIPEYAPLVFEIELVADPDAEEEEEEEEE